MFHFGSIIRKLRVEKKLTQAELANLVGCSDLHITKIENGIRTASPQLVEKAINALVLDFSSEKEVKEYEDLVHTSAFRGILEELRTTPKSELPYILNLIKLTKQKYKSKSSKP